MDTYLVATFFYLFALPAHAQQYASCEESYVDFLLKELRHFTDRAELNFGDSPAHLLAECVPAQSASSWLNRYNKNCMSSALNATLEGQQKLVMELCNKGQSLRERYLRNLNCLANMSDGFRYCKDKFDRNQRDIGVVEYEDKARLLCCSFEGYRRCLQILSSAQTGCASTEPIGDVIDDIIMKRDGSAHEACAEHVERCVGSGSWRTASELNILFPIAAMIILLWSR